MYTDDWNKKFLKKFFDTHYVFRTNSFPWQLFNKENGRKKPTTNEHVRVDYMFAETGFFNEMIKELDTSYLENLDLHTDFAHFHRQKRYVVQSHIEDNFHNPTHHSFRTYKKNYKIDFNNIDSVFPVRPERYISMMLVTHPGHTRFEASCFLKKNLDNALVYVNKEHYYDDMFTKKMKRITDIKELVESWKPLPISFENENGKKFENIIVPKEKSFFRFVFSMDKRYGLKNGTKYHEQTDCNVLKLWDYRPAVGPEEFRKKHLLHTVAYVKESINSGKGIAQIWGEKPITIYTNSDKDIKKHFENNRKKLVEFAKGIMKDRKEKGIEVKYYFHQLSKFKFDVVKIENTPDVDLISMLNDNDGFAMWIDDSIVEEINRELYEFLFFAKQDVKLSKTFDDKLWLVNCKLDEGKTWKINKEFYL